MITAEVIGDEAVVARLRAFGEAARAGIRQALEDEGARLVRTIKADKLSGQVLRNRTGTLRRSIIGPPQLPIEDLGGELVATVAVQRGPAVVYGHAHEYGVDQDVTVRAHTRQTAAGEVAVRSYGYHMHLRERSFMRSSLREAMPGIRSALQRAVQEAAA